MNTLSKLSFIALALSLVACNEKVSPELQSGNSVSSTTTSGGGSAVIPDEYYFRVTNTNDTLLNFKLHKSGLANVNANCEITSASALSSDAYRNDPATNDITCFMEAEELSLYYNGLSYGIESSANTCPYIGYSPFSYFRKMPGDSSASVTLSTCGAGIDDAFLNTHGAPAPASCDQYYDSTLLTAFSVTAEEDLCRFNYPTADNPASCDIGIISITKNAYVRAAGPDLVLGNADDTQTKTTTLSTKKCGGKVANCIEGPITNVSANKYTNVMEVSKGSVSAPFSKTITLANYFNVYGSNIKYANYRRDLASLEIEYGNSAKPLTNSYMSSWGDPTHRYDYNPELMSLYSKNKRMDGTTLVTDAMILAEQTRNAYKAKPLAAEAFVGLSGSTSPFYTFYCLDNAYDIRARIRMVVRDWDRILSTTATSTSFARLSDVDLLPPQARQDVPYTVEVTSDADSLNEFNDILDWDDRLDMERDDSGVAYDPTITIWRPMPDATYTEGFFNPSWFIDDKL